MQLCHQTVSNDVLISYDYFMTNGFTVTAVLTGILRALSLQDPTRWSILTAYTASITAFTLVVRSEDIAASLMRSYMAHTVYLGVCVISALALVPLLVYIWWASKRNVTEHHRVHKLHQSE